ncbi:MAG: DUF465 domain-containing protein [Acidobacteriaceae bacterium]|nr:DUF465 domain-containing protein [Acidobacteriaceae bacterium]
MQTADPLELPTHSSTPSLSELAQEHSLYDQRLEALRAKTHLTDEEMMEEVKLKKLKLSLKDRMEQIRRQALHAQ